MRPRRALPFAAALAFAVVVSANAAEVAVDLKNDDSRQVSVPQGTSDGVTAASDFQVLDKGGREVAVIYPADLYADRFWSQPLPDQAYREIRTGMAVRPVTLGTAAHSQVRAERKARQEELRAEVERARRQALQEEIEKLAEKREALIAQRDELDSRIASAQMDLFEAEGRMETEADSRDEDVDRALETIAQLSDQREELQRQRETLSNKQPFPKADAARLTSQIKSLSDQIDSARRDVKTARDRQRAARSRFLARKDDWRKLAAQRADYTAQIQALTNRIQSLSRQLKGSGGS